MSSYNLFLVRTWTLHPKNFKAQTKKTKKNFFDFDFFLVFFTVKMGEIPVLSDKYTHITWKYLRQTLGMDKKARPQVRKRVRNGPMAHRMPLYPPKLEEKPLLLYRQSGENPLLERQIHP